MINIMKIISKILFKRKVFLIATFLLPLFLIVMTFTSNGDSNYKAALINKDEGEFASLVEDSLENCPFIDLTNIKGDYNFQDLIYHKYEMILIIDEDFTEKLLDGDETSVKYKILNEGENSYAVTEMLQGQISSLASICKNVDVKNEGIDEVIKTYENSKPCFERKRKDINIINIRDSMGFLFYIIFISSSLSCVFLLEDEKLGTKDRTIMGNISEMQYYGAHILIYTILAAVPCVEYYVLCIISHINFGVPNKLLILLICLLTALLAVTFNVLISAIIKNKALFTLVGSCFTLPMFMLSGCFWPYDMMSENLQSIGRIFPTRWLLEAMENLQKGDMFIDILPNLFGVVMLSILFFAIAVYCTKNKRVLIKSV